MYQRILVPIDGSDTSNAGLDEAIKLAKLTGAGLRLIHVVDDLTLVGATSGFVDYAGEMIQYMRDAGKQILEQGKQRVTASGIPVDTELFETIGERVSDLIEKQVKSWNADLIVIGTHGRRGASRLVLGSDAEQIVRVATVPVLLVRGAIHT